MLFFLLFLFGESLAEAMGPKLLNWWMVEGSHKLWMAKFREVMEQNDGVEFTTAVRCQAMRVKIMEGSWHEVLVWREEAWTVMRVLEVTAMKFVKMAVVR